MTLRLRVSGTDATTGYNQGGFYYGSSLVAHSRITNDTGTSILIGDNVGSNIKYFAINLYNPFLSAITHSSHLGTNGNGVLTHSLGNLNNSTSYTGASFLVNTGTLTGKIQVFGFNQ